MIEDAFKYLFQSSSRMQNAQKAQEKIEYIRTKQFFITKHNYKDFQQDVQKNDYKRINSVEFQCSGHGAFKKIIVAKRFIKHLQKTIEHASEVRKIIIKISGFNLNYTKQILQIKKSKEKANRNLDLDNTLQQLVTNAGEYQQNTQFSFTQRLKHILQNRISQLESLQIRINNVHYCQIKDYKRLLLLGLSVESSQRLTNLSLQFSDWTFYKIEERNPNAGQQIIIYVPSLDEMNFNEIALNLKNIKSFKVLKRFRLQISTWFYSQAEYEKLIDSISEQLFKGYNKLKLMNKAIKSKNQYLHYEIHSFVSKLLSYMPALTHMQLDFRNWHSKFQMSSLKSALLNISKKVQIQKNQNQNILNKTTSQEIQKNQLNQHQMEKQHNLSEENNIVYGILKLIEAKQKDKQQGFTMNVVI